MAFVYADRVQETSTTTGTGTYDLAGAVTGFQTFVAGIGTTNTCHYSATMGADWEVGVGTVTDAATDTLARTAILASSNSNNAVNWGAGAKTIFCTIAAAKLAPNVQTMTATGSADSWEKPNGGYSMCRVQLWGAGGSGGKGRANSAGGGGGGGQYIEKLFLLSELGATEQVTIGAGGAAQTTADSNGNVGGNTTFGASATLVTAYGGGPGMGTNTSGLNGGGHGGGPISAGGTQTLGTTTTFATTNYPLYENEGVGGKFGTNGSTAPERGGHTTFNGAGGSGAASGGAHTILAGGSSIYGGAGGGAGATDSSPGPGAGGTSRFGGNGGAGAYDANAATAGSQPGGGGGGSETGTSGAGGNGKAIITCW